VKTFRSLTRYLYIVLFCWFVSATTAHANNRDEVIFFFNDALGSAVAAVNESGDLCWSEEYTAYGDKTLNEDLFPDVGGCGILGEERGFTGHTEDVNSDLVYMQQRYYDPSIGRFLSIDPREADPNQPMTFNRYAYGNNNPYKYTDPDGEFVFVIPILTFLAKEAVAEVASRATDGATDFLSTRRAVTKLAKAAGKRIRRTSDNVPMRTPAESVFDPRGTAGAAKAFTSIKGRLKAAQLPIPQKGYNPSNPLARGPNNGFIDRFGNEWVRGPSRTKGQAFEWDVQLSKTGREKLGWATRDGSHANVSLDGRITHR